MRYIIEPTQKGIDNNVWNTINSLSNQELIMIVEKGDPLENMKENLRKISRSIELLNKVGFNQEVLMLYLHAKTKIAQRTIKTILYEQNKFFIKLGVDIK